MGVWTVIGGQILRFFLATMSPKWGSTRSILQCHHPNKMKGYVAEK